MLIVMHSDATDAEIRSVMDRIESLGYRAHPIPGSLRTAIGITGNKGSLERGEFEVMPGVDQAVPVTKPYKLVSREARDERTCVNVAGVPIGEGTFTVIAGPCAVESREQLFEVAEQVKKAGAHLLRGGAFKPRTSPYSFQGLGEEGLKHLAAARKEFDIPVVTEAMDSEGVKLVEEYADAIQIGARNMQNYSLLKAAGRARKPVFLKRGMSATLDELLMAAEYIYSEGNYQVFLCERGVRTFSMHTRNTLDLSVVPAVQEHSHLPILVDTSHGTGRRDKVPALSLAALAVGSDGLMVEVHHDPDKALSDGPQALFPEMFSKLMADLKAMAPLVGRTIEN
ncbi:MAG: 3-deoxy-7-phosphoheptulonate synthase [Acidobacteria bacterium]|nr:MAG: 3-deoxy-7-phosphoheptulonate synthase [Acidobacteriota bacterium]